MGLDVLYADSRVFIMVAVFVLLEKISDIPVLLTERGFKDAPKRTNRTRTLKKNQGYPSPVSFPPFVYLL
jgi:hypothetical protein